MPATPIGAAADKYALYARAFQNPHEDVQFCNKIYKQLFGRAPVTLREDFCGAAEVACEFVRCSNDRYATAVDIDAEPLAWCREYLLPRLPPHVRARIQLLHDDALTVDAVPVDIIAALNSSFFVIKQRQQLLAYFRHCFLSQKDKGILTLGFYAGPEAYMLGRDVIRCDGFKAIWEQSESNAVTNETTNRVHFRFPDGSSMSNAFVYNYRMWTPREVAECLLECGYRDVRLYSRRDAINADQRIEECKQANVSTYWDVFVVGLKREVALAD